YCRGRLLDHVSVTVKKGGEAKVELKPTVGVGGVYRITVFEERANDTQRNLVPVAERLVYRQPAEQLLLTAKPDKSVYVPSDPVKRTITALNEQEKAAPAILMVAVVDKSIVTMADEKTHRSMPTHFLMTSEVKKPEDLEYADFLVGSHPRAGAALDLLLGTQGWRRFFEQDPTRLKQHQADEADRLLVSTGMSQRPVDLEKEQGQRVKDEMAAKQTRLQDELRETNERLQSGRTDAAYLVALNKVQNYDEWLRTARQFAIPFVCLVLLIVTIATLVAGLMRRISRAVPLLLTSAACAVVACVLFVNYTQDKPQGSQVVGLDSSKSTAGADTRDADRFLGEKLDKAEGRPVPQEAAGADPAVREMAPAMAPKPGMAEPAKGRAVGIKRAMPVAPPAPAVKADGGKDLDKENQRLHIQLEKAKEEKEADAFYLRADDAKKDEARAAGGAKTAPANQNDMGNTAGLGGMQGGFGGQGMGGPAPPRGFGAQPALGGLMPAQDLPAGAEAMKAGKQLQDGLWKDQAMDRKAGGRARRQL